MEELQQKGALAKEASIILAKKSSEEKNKGLIKAADFLLQYKDEIIKANEIDLQFAKENGIKGSLIDRLTLNEKRIESMAEGLRQIAMLEDPVGEVLSMKKRPNGLVIGQKRVPMGVIGIIYEARPNVTADAFGLCLKTGNAVILRGGKEAIHSNIQIVKILKNALDEAGLPKESVQLVEDTSRETAKEMMRLNEYLDVLIPRGGAGLIQTVVQNSTVPVIETGIGNCHIYVDHKAKLDEAVSITVNAKVQRPGVCNAAESLLVHKDVAEIFLPKVYDELKKYNVEIRGDEKVLEILPDVNRATEEDWGMEYLDYIISVKVVDSIDEAIGHINKYGTKHSEAIITEDYTNAQRFLEEIDAAAVYVNASTRFTDGFEFGFGAEIGISTQKLHARGPMGLKELTTIKYIIYGNGQIRQ
ncbi:MAG: glutamate-5-semialdehyde dehydrogenase [Epulopiscium sp.]|jgi:glutamate-5-semialdehyde dehydrogenase|uniref:Gamma-glutamyl phosphate reductase n=1 Tax=Defluviitalea raffinosedens TaxID=1450156 RepID=A0A7C8LRC8_9FIRM|nr:glutamate-5-semialdehyde dehydrogenase [Defluviitalea raffinosedens]MBZ4667821.1 proA [Defluviitaleaceae bacterium]MDK2788430.1 glutamate-5-semialdehyde dehydrogenase [Candidatus Epulonipiscium sp.]KAE9636885.1 glutamate-5-semialdehyde dehydrogenase [Defluviitalea raffinosedens]MBM7686408.1 glutamate-5-semialdehyde dehydrogenase [Defluviitalea raffinosedens]HHW67194.1 glutamate-5-semialdehyde dehydrogenase [Candidatus Epulonipiscium sp.]